MGKERVQVWIVEAGLATYIRNPGSQIPAVAQVEQLPKTSENLETWPLGDVGPFSRKPD